MKLLLLICLFVVPQILFSASGVPFAAAAALMISVAVAWITEVVPVGVTALLIPCCGVLLGLVAPKDAFNSFGADIVFLILVVCLMARAFETSNLGRRVAYFVLTSRFVGRSLQHGVYGLTIVGTLLGMWMVNSAVCSILLPISLGIISSLEAHLDAHAIRNLSKRLLFLCSVTPGLAGLATPVGAAPNLFAFRYLADHGFNLSFTTWFLLASPIALIMVGLSVLILDWLYPVTSIDASVTRDLFLREKEKLGPVTKKEIVVAVSFGSLIGMWLVPPNLQYLLPSATAVVAYGKLLTPTVVAVICLVPLFVCGGTGGTPLVTSDLKQVDLNTILLFGGGLTLGTILESSGLAHGVAAILAGFATSHPIVIATAIVITTLLLSEFCSNTAAVALVLPITLSLAQVVGLAHEATRFALLVLFAGTLGFSLPAGTVPNGIVYSSGRLTVVEMVKTGIWVDLMGAIVIVVSLEVLYRVLGIL